MCIRDRRITGGEKFFVEVMNAANDKIKGDVKIVNGADEAKTCEGG